MIFQVHKKCEQNKDFKIDGKGVICWCNTDANGFTKCGKCGKNRCKFTTITTKEGGLWLFGAGGNYTRLLLIIRFRVRAPGDLTNQDFQGILVCFSLLPYGYYLPLCYDHVILPEDQLTRAYYGCHLSHVFSRENLEDGSYGLNVGPFLDKLYCVNDFGLNTVDSRYDQITPQ